ncbi:MAG: hypothetical protein HY332_11390, partial [Chloroflexi bacterium]|nr:hypothetical protein [Chloroflexota bacterium]
WERGPGGEGISATARHFADAGVLRFDAPAVVALIRTRKRPRNTLFGGAVGGALAYVGSPDGSGNRLRIEREAAVVEGNFTVYPACPLRRRALARAVRDNPPGREGRQWLFVARLLLAARRPGAAAARLWRGYVRPLVESVRTPATSHWALDAGVEHGDDWARIESTVAGPDGETAAWARAIRVRREYRATAGGLRVDELIERAGSGQTDGSRISRVAYLVPAEARDLAVHASHDVRRRRPGGRRLEMRPGAAGFSLGVTYVV